MKTLTDLSIFQNRRAKQILREARSIIYHDTSEKPHEELKLDAVLPLGCEYFTYSHLREHKVFQRRINQQFFRSSMYIPAPSISGVPIRDFCWNRGILSSCRPDRTMICCFFRNWANTKGTV